LASSSTTCEPRPGSASALAERMGTTQSVISRLEEGGGAKNRLDTLARVATALNRHLIVSFPEKVPARLKDAVQVA
jgi:transcriptional regulator with XRE-family HTH domain